MSKEIMENLEPCPFCNSRPELTSVDSEWNKHQIVCTNCGAKMTEDNFLSHKTDEAIIKKLVTKWNRRGVSNE